MMDPIFSSTLELWTKQNQQFLQLFEMNFFEFFSIISGIEDERAIKLIAWFKKIRQQADELRNKLLDEYNQFSLNAASDEIQNYQKALAAYFVLHSKMEQEMLKLLQSKLIASLSFGRPIKDLRQFYELWLNCGSEVYDKTIKSRKFSIVYGSLINAVMRLWNEPRILQ